MRVEILSTPEVQAGAAKGFSKTIERLRATDRFTPEVKLILLGRLRMAQNAGVISTDAYLELRDELGKDFVAAYEREADLAARGYTEDELDAIADEVAAA